MKCLSGAALAALKRNCFPPRRAKGPIHPRNSPWKRRGDLRRMLLHEQTRSPQANEKNYGSNWFRVRKKEYYQEKSALICPEKKQLAFLWPKTVINVDET